MSIVATTLQERLNRRLEGLRDASEIKPGHPSVETAALRNSHARARADGFVFDADEPVSKVGGTGTAPRPLRYFLAGFAFCLQAQYVRNAVRIGIDLDELAVDVTWKSTAGAARGSARNRSTSSTSSTRRRSGPMRPRTRHVPSCRPPGPVVTSTGRSPRRGR
jgi:hypothetical protein